MKKKYLLNLTLAILVPFFFFSCEEEIDPPQPDFSATVSTSTSDISITFSDLSSKSPDEWLWTFEGGNPSTSTEQNPTVTYSSHGTFDVTLVATNEGGENEIVKYDYINIGEFNNPTWTEMDITVSSVTKTIPVDGSVLFANIDNSSMSYYAETYGATTSGNQIGLKIYWDSTADLSEYSAWNLIVNSDYVFINVTNNGSDDLYPFHVNYGTTAVSVDYITIENDGIKKSTGYYDAYNYMEIRAYFYSDQNSWVYWKEDTHFYLPWESNQGLNLSNSYKKDLNATQCTTSAKKAKNTEAKSIVQSNKK